MTYTETASIAIRVVLAVKLNDQKFEWAWSQSVFSRVITASEKAAAGAGCKLTFHL